VKVKTRATVEVIIGAVTGSLQRPKVVVAGRYRGAELEMVGRTVPLTDQQAAELAKLLTPAWAVHPWPEEIGSGRWGGKGAMSRNDDDTFLPGVRPARRGARVNTVPTSFTGFPHSQPAAKRETHEHHRRARAGRVHGRQRAVRSKRDRDDMCRVRRCETATTKQAS
jgi:hypothetical protein